MDLPEDPTDNKQYSNLESGAVWVETQLSIGSQLNKMKERYNIRAFDVFFLENDGEYQCYLDALKSLIEKDEKVSCDFLERNNYYRQMT